MSERSLDQRLVLFGLVDENPSFSQRLLSTKTSDDTGWEVADSAIHGKGIMATKPYVVGDIVGKALDPSGKDWELTELARFCNHQKHQNSDIKKNADGEFDLVAIKDIDAGDEITSNYEQVTEAIGPDSEMRQDGKPVPVVDTRDYELQKEAAVGLQGFMDRSELMGSRGRALKYGRPEPEGRDYDRVVFTDDAEDQQALMENLREVAKIKGYKQHERPDGFLTVSGDNQDLSVYPTSKRDKIYNAWELIEGGMSKDEAWDQIAKEAKDKIEFVHSCCGKPAGECAGCPSGSSLILKDEHESA